MLRTSKIDTQSQKGWQTLLRYRGFVLIVEATFYGKQEKTDYFFQVGIY